MKSTSTSLSNLRSLIADLEDAQRRLLETQKFPDDLIHNESALQRFEFTFELVWKTMQIALRFKGETSKGPRDSIRAVAQYDLIDDPQVWFMYLENRNLTTRVYNTKMAQKVLETLSDFSEHVGKFIRRVHKHILDKETP